MLPKFGKFLVLYLGCGSDLISQPKWLYVTSYSCPWIKYLTEKTIKYSKMLRSVAIYVKRKSNISFSTKKSSFDQHFLMVKTFLKIFWWWFLVPHSDHLLVSSATLSCMTQNILTLSVLVYYNTNSCFLRSFSFMHLLQACSSSLIIKVLSEIHFEVSLFHVAP